MRRRASLVLLLLAAGARGEQAPPPAGVTVDERAAGRIVEAVLPAVALDLAASPAGVATLVAPGDDPEGRRTLLHFDPSEAGSLTTLAADLPAKTDAVGWLDLGGDGRPDVIVGEPGKIWDFGPAGDGTAGRAPRRLLAAPGLDLRALRRHGLVRTDQAWIARPRLGRLELYRGAPMGLDGAFDLPTRAKRLPSGLLLSTPRVRLPAASEAGSAPIFAVGPERHGARRLSITLIDPSADDSARAVETWARLPANERVAQSWFLAVDGRPTLAVATLSADKLGIFEKKKLRVFPLATDRTRAGRAPSLEIATVTRNWYDLGVHAGDFDLDGRDDLAIVQPDGLGAKKLVVEVYRGQGNGGFYRTPRRSVVVAPDAAWAFGTDVDGDRAADLVTVDENGLRVFRGLAQHKKLALEKKPGWSFEVAPAGVGKEVAVVVGADGDGDGDSDGDGDGDSDSDHDADQVLSHLEVIDFDGDGRGEILLRSEVGGRTVLRAVALR